MGWWAGDNYRCTEILVVWCDLPDLTTWTVERTIHHGGKSDQYLVGFYNITLTSINMY